MKVLEKHLLTTALCDFQHVSIQELKKNLLGRMSEAERIAHRVYEYLHDTILYEFDAWAVSASQTLQKQAGMCFNKSNLMIALLRASGIPCVYTLFWIGKDGFRFTSDSEMFEKIQDRTVHVYVEAYLGDKIGWRRFVDTSLDTHLRCVLQKQGYEPFQNILTDLPIERFATAEEVIAWRKKYKESIGAEDSITKVEMEKSNKNLRKLRDNS